VLVEQVRQPISRTRPRLDRELEQLAAPRGEADLTGLEVTIERDEPKRVRRPLDHAHGPVPRPRHAHDELVADRHRPIHAENLGKARELARRDPIEDALPPGTLTRLLPSQTHVLVEEFRPRALAGGE
jgi:hypothetical protein